MAPVVSPARGGPLGSPPNAVADDRCGVALPCVPPAAEWGTRVGPVLAAALAGAGVEALGRVEAWRVRAGRPVALGPADCPAPGCPPRCPAQQQARPVVRRPPAPLTRGLPPQHGAWGMLGTGLALAVIAAGGPSAAGGCAVLAAAAGFVALHAFVGSRLRAGWVAGLAVAGATVGLVGAWGAGAPAMAAAPLALAIALGVPAQLGLRRHGPRALAPLVASTLALGAAIAAVALAAGATRGAAAAAAALVVAHGVWRLFSVRGLLRGPAAPRARVRAAVVVPALSLVAVAAAGASPWLAVAFVPGALATAALARAAAPPPVRRIGQVELAVSTAFLVLAGIGLVPR